MMSVKTLIRTMSNKRLLDAVNKIRKEKQNPSVYGKNGTSRYVTSSEFWQGHHQDLKNELMRRKKEGSISNQAGTRKRKQGPS